jgi:adenylate kinase
MVSNLTHFQARIAVGSKQMIFVAGISRSGKSSMIEAFSKAQGFTHVKASGLLKEADRPLGPLSRTEADENQRVLIELLKTNEHINNSKTILDGHAIIETTEGIFPVPDSLFDELRPIKIICIVNDPATIARRRAQTGWHLDPEDVSRFQEIEQQYARAQSDRLQVPYYEIEAGNLVGFASAIEG